MFLENLSNYIDYLCLERGLSENTEAAYRHDLMEFIDFIDANGINSFDDIKRSHINYYIRDLRRKELAPTSVTRKIASLRGWFKWMMGMSLIKHDPTVALEHPKLSKHLPKVLSVSEVDLLLSQDLPLLEKSMLELLYATGLRVSELANLKIQNINQKHAYVKCFGKGSKERIVPMGKIAKEILGQYLEKRTDYKGKLGTGGSVASSAWDFARYVGCKTIFLAGLDLGFPKKRTHTQNSTFEQNVFTQCNKTQSSENSHVKALYGANTFYKTDYEGKPVLTDNRMSMYAWWFESKISQYSNIDVFSITPESLSIPGVKISSLENLLLLPKVEQKLDSFLEIGEGENLFLFETRKDKLKKALDELKSYLTEIKEIVTIGLSLTKKTGLTKQEYPELFYNLQQIDKKLVNTEASELISLIFPTEEDLQDFIEKRYKEMPEGSYTTSLFKKGLNRMAQKVGEEAVETVIEATNGTDDRLIYEASDMIYHLIVLLTSKGLRIDDLAKELKTRHKC